MSTHGDISSLSLSNIWILPYHTHFTHVHSKLEAAYIYIFIYIRHICLAVAPILSDSQ